MTAPRTRDADHPVADDDRLAASASANAPRRRRFGIDEALVGHLQLAPGETLVDLGCGSGFTLAAAAQREPGLRLVGVDRDARSLAAAHEVLGELGVAHELMEHDLAEPLPLPDGSVDHIVSHNVLEQLRDPSALLVEAHRVLRSGAVSVWSHPDYDSVVVSGGDVELTRRIIHAFADLADPDMDHADGQMGRKLVPLVRQSPLHLVGMDSRSLLSADLEGPARMRIWATTTALCQAAEGGQVGVTVDEVRGWRASLERADAEGRFFYAHTTFIAIARKP